MAYTRDGWMIGVLAREDGTKGAQVVSPTGQSWYEVWDGRERKSVPLS